MPCVRVGKLRFLHILEMLYLQTDEEHKLSSKQILAKLEEYGIFAERKCIYDDIETLKSFGLEIYHDSCEPAGYYMINGPFELPELKILVDAVQSSQFITKKKTAELIFKLGCLTSKSQARKLQEQVYCVKRIKSTNEAIYYYVDAIHDAIHSNRKISFQFLAWNMNKELVPKYDFPVIVSPWALTWEDENYFLLGYDEVSGKMKRYRVEKMRDIKLLKEKREGSKTFDRLEMASFAIKTFGMFSGEVEKVMLECDNELIGDILDRFGTDVIIVPEGTSKFRVTLEVAVSRYFFGWIVGLGPGVRVVYPENVKNAFKDRLSKMI